MELTRNDHIRYECSISPSALSLNIMARWIDKFDQYGFESLYRPGRVERNRVILSRRSCGSAYEHCRRREVPTHKSRKADRKGAGGDAYYIRKLKEEVQDLRPVIHHLRDSSTKPARERVAANSPVIKNH